MGGQLAVRAACHTDGFGWTVNNERGRLLSSDDGSSQSSNQLKPDSLVCAALLLLVETRERRVPDHRGCCFQPGGFFDQPTEHQAGGEGEALSRAASPA